MVNIKKIFKKSFANLKEEKIYPNNANFGDKILNYLKETLSQKLSYHIKTDWISKDDELPLITITKGMDEIQELQKTKIVSYSFDIWCKDKKKRDILTKESFSLIKKINFKKNILLKEVNLSNPIHLNFEEKKGIYRSQFDLTLYCKIKVDKKKLELLEEIKEKELLFEKLVLGDNSFGGKISESKNGKYALFNPSTSSNTLAFIENKKLIWKKEFDNLVSFELSNDGSYIVIAAQLTEKEYGKKSYKSGGHICLLDKTGKYLLNLKTSSDGLSCSISPNNKFFGASTMGPDWEVYYGNTKGKLLWKKRFNKDVGGIEVTNKEIILYDKIHKPTRKKVWVLDNKGNIISK